MGNHFPNHRIAALTLINEASLNIVEGSFAGYLIFSDSITDNEKHSLAFLLKRYGLPPLAEEGSR